jgi:amidase
MAPLALGTETDGSIVGPAGHCGVAGIKPPPGMLPSAGVVPVSDTEDAVGLLAPTLRDAALALAALGGTPTPEPRPPRTLRLGLWRLPGLPRPASLAVAAAVERLTAEGVTVVEVDLVPDRAMLVDGLKAMYAEFRPSVERYLRTRPGVPQTLPELIAGNLADPVELSLFGQDLFETALRIGPRARQQALACRARAVEQSRALLDGLLRRHRLDALCAASNEPAWVVEHGLGDPYSTGSSTVAALARRCNTTIPLHPPGLPVGLSVFGPADTAELLGVALGVEDALERTAVILPGILPMAACGNF